MDSHTMGIEARDAVIMMVDDEPILMELIQAFLEEEGYRHFLLVEDSTKALATLKENRPDVLLLDLMMPEVDGFEILSELRKDEAHRYLPVLVLTSSTDSETKLRALEMGATDFLAKPVDPSELALRLRNTLMVKAYQDQLTHYDQLTQLPNRALFLDRLDWAIQRSHRTEKPTCVMTFALDRFKQINETFGPAVGDQILVEIASRIRATVRQDDVVSASGVARLAGDEFSILLPEVDSEESVALVAKRLLATLTSPFVVGDGQEVFLTASIGIATCPGDGEDRETLMKHASIATEFAKKFDRGSFQYYSDELDSRSKELYSLESDLRRAIERDQLELYYQPKVSTVDGSMVGAESLIRWHHPERGMVSPGVFIPLAEETGLINDLGRWILRQVCRYGQRLTTLGYDTVKLSVNVSAAQIKDSDLCSFIDEALRTTGFDPHRLVVEITESVMMGDVETNLTILHDIRNLGVHLSIDDFGTGYSSLSYLKRFPISELKIDKAFIDDVATEDEDAAIVRAVIALAQALELEVTAEGVEDADQVAFLQRAGCDLIQGYHYSKPLPATDLEAYLQHERGQDQVPGQTG